MGAAQRTIPAFLAGALALACSSGGASPRDGGADRADTGASDRGPGGAGGGHSGGAGGAASGGSAGGQGAMGGGAGPGGRGAPAGTGGAAGAAARPSFGCGAANPPASGTYLITVGGTPREYILTLPDGYDAQRPYRLVLAFHGHMYTAQSVAEGGPPGSGPYYGIQSQSNNSTIFVAPQAIGGGWSSSDLDFVTAMVVQLEAQLCIDEARIFATGFSMGAIMTITIGCGEGDLFRAIAAMSGELSGSCSGSHPVAYWASHGMSDPTIAIADGQAARDRFLSIDGCASTTSPPDGDGCLAYQGCAAGEPVVWCPFDGVHEPPPFAGPAIWSFLSQF